MFESSFHTNLGCNLQIWFGKRVISRAFRLALVTEFIPIKLTEMRKRTTLAEHDVSELLFFRCSSSFPVSELQSSSMKKTSPRAA